MNKECVLKYIMECYVVQKGGNFVMCGNMKGIEGIVLIKINYL